MTYTEQRCRIRINYLLATRNSHKSDKCQADNKGRQCDVMMVRSLISMLRGIK